MEPYLFFTLKYQFLWHQWLIKLFKQSFQIYMLPPDQLRLVGCLIFAIPLSYLMSCLRQAKHIIILTCSVSIIMQVIVFQYQAPLLWIQQNIVYFLCKYCKRQKIGKLVLLQTFVTLIIIQIRRMYISYGAENVDITAIFMMQTFLYVGFAYNYQDGISSNSNMKTQRTIYQLPKYTEYLGYVLFIPSCLVGPVFQFSDYHNYINRKGVYSEVKKGFSIPGIKKQLKTFIITIVLYIALSPLNINYMLSEQFAQSNFLYQTGYLLISIVGARFKYYSAWSLGMIGCNATGLTTNPIKKQDGSIENQWDRVIVSDIYTFQMDPSMKKKADAWNIPIQLALKRYIYDRQYIPSQPDTPKQKKRHQLVAQQKTLFVSALWHGLYPGYFVSFFHWALILQVSQQFFRMQRDSPKLSKWRKQLYYLELIFINHILGYFGCCFLFMSWQKIIIFFKATHFIPVVTVYILNIIFVRLALFSKHKHGHHKTTHDQIKPKVKVWPDQKQVQQNNKKVE